MSSAGQVAAKDRTGITTPCHACGDAALAELSAYRSFRRVSSDCRPWPAGGRLAFCQSCATLQSVVDDDWRREADDLYAGYTIYHQSHGLEQPVFDQRQGDPSPRSRRLIAKLREHVALPQRGRALDVGCGNGAFLRAMSEALPRWSLVGTELGGAHRAQIEAIRQVEGFYDTTRPADVPGRFDSVSMIHVLEHITDPIAFLSSLTDKLTPDGRLFIQLPYFEHNPFELLIADHCTHFTPASLEHVLARSGFTTHLITTDWVAKELSAVATPAVASTCDATRPAGQITATHHAAEHALQWLSDVRHQAKRVSVRGQFGIFGTSIAGTWLAAELGDSLDFFVDEDPHRIGSTHLGLPILHPDAVADDTDLFIALPTSLAHAVRDRIARPSIRYHLPPNLPQLPR